MFLPCFHQQSKPARERKKNLQPWREKKNQPLKINLLIIPWGQNCSVMFSSVNQAVWVLFLFCKQDHMFFYIEIIYKRVLTEVSD